MIYFLFFVMWIPAAAPPATGRFALTPEWQFGDTGQKRVDKIGRKDRDEPSLSLKFYLPWIKNVRNVA